MGKIVKVKELRQYDVFKDSDVNFIYLGDGYYIRMGLAHFINKQKFTTEAEYLEFEVIGRMEFVPTEDKENFHRLSLGLPLEN